MTMVPSLRSPAGGRTRVAGTVWMIVVLLASVSFAEEPPVHFWHADAMPPGAIGQGQLTRGGPLPGYFQPVEILAPQGARVSMAEPGRFQKPTPAPLGVGLLIGQVYRLKVTNIPGYEGAEVYPTIEIIDRLYPPVGQEMRFPIPIDLSQEEIELAASGRFVMRVVYLEDPNDALPIDELPDEQTVFQALPGENPLTVADRLGRPMAILRIGGRVPDADGPDEAFLYGSPPWLKFQPVPVERPALKPPAPLARTQGKSQGQATRHMCRRWARQFRGTPRHKSTSPPASSRATIPCQPTSASEPTRPGRFFDRLPLPAPVRWPRWSLCCFVPAARFSRPPPADWRLRKSARSRLPPIPTTRRPRPIHLAMMRRPTMPRWTMRPPPTRRK